MPRRGKSSPRRDRRRGWCAPAGLTRPPPELLFGTAQFVEDVAGSLDRRILFDNEDVIESCRKELAMQPKGLANAAADAITPDGMAHLACDGHAEALPFVVSRAQDDEEGASVDAQATSLRMAIVYAAA